MLFEKSRYVGLDTFKNSDNTLIFTRRDKRTFNKDKCKMYMFKKDDKLDVLSYKFYGDSFYWWCILDCNPQYMSEIEIKSGDHILIPPKSEVLRYA